jgi:hypothetical protein
MDPVKLGEFGKQSTGEVLSVGAAGRKQLERELETWDRLSGAIALVLGRAAEVSS